jgi:hypothetical protein
VPSRPLSDAVEWFAAEEQILEQDQESGGGIDPAAAIGAGQIVAEGLFESQSFEDAIDDGEQTDAVGEELVSGRACVLTEV